MVGWHTLDLIAIMDGVESIPAFGAGKRLSCAADTVFLSAWDILRPDCCVLCTERVRQQVHGIANNCEWLKEDLPFRWAAFQPHFPKTVALHGVVVTQMQDLALGLVKTHTVDLCPSIQPVRSPCIAFLPSSRLTLLPNLVSSANLLRVHSTPSSNSLIKMLNNTGPNTEPWEPAPSVLLGGSHLAP